MLTLIYICFTISQVVLDTQFLLAVETTEKQRMRLFQSILWYYIVQHQQNSVQKGVAWPIIQQQVAEFWQYLFYTKNHCVSPLTSEEWSQIQQMFIKDGKKHVKFIPL